MVRKKLAAVVATLGALQAGMVSALGIGELSLQSTLNQPFVAEIKLLNVGDLDGSQILVGLAGQEDFANAGVAREFFLTNLKFKVQLDNNGNGVIRLTSRKPVIEPYLNFLIETRWPSGRLLREYTVLLDLPVFSESQAQPIESASSSPVRNPSTTRRPDPILSDNTSPVQDTPRTEPDPFIGGDLDPGSEYRVNDNDTLWEIAADSRPSARVSVQQTMLGIQRLNPSAFTENNINRLKAGSVLRLPTEDDLQEVSRQEAVDEVASQNRTWRNGDASTFTDTGAQLDATSRSLDSGGDFQEVDRLSIATGGNSDSSLAGDGEGVGGAGTQALRDRLVQNQEILEKTRREKLELKSRLDDVQTKLKTLQRLVALKDDQLAAMQGSQSDAVVAEDAPTQLETLDTDAIKSLGSNTGDELESPNLDDPLAEDGLEEAASDNVPQPLAAEESGLFDTLLDNLFYIIGIILLVLGGVAAVKIRRQREEEDEFDMDDELQSDELAAASFNMDELLESDDEDPFEENLDIGDQLAEELEEEIAADNATKIAAQPQNSGGQNQAAQQAQLQPETGDAIAEADIYVAYGRYQQAVDLLRSAINQEPQRSDLQVKLLDVYIETRDKPGFQQQYMQLNALGDNSAIAEVKEMLSSVDDVADWLNDLPNSPRSGNFTDADMDADLIEGDDFGLNLDENEFADASLDSELDLDLDLDLGDDRQQSTRDTGEFNALDLDIDKQGNAAVRGNNFSATSNDGSGSELTFDMDANDSDNSGFGDAEGFELDLDDEDDFDLDFADLGDNASLGELESEFGDTGESRTLAKNNGMSLDFNGVDDLDVELDLPTGIENTAELDFSNIQDGGQNGYNGRSQNNGSKPVNGSNGNGQEFDFLADTDEVATKLDLARAYIDMGDSEGAKDILDEVLQEGNTAQKREADSLIERID